MALESFSPVLSYDDYAAIDDGNRYQVIEGELLMTPSPRTRHQRIVLNLGRHLANFAYSIGAGEVFLAPLDVVLKTERPAVVLQPDALFISTERSEIITEANIQGAPDLVVEVLSPSNIRLDTVVKRRLYAQYGVKEYWIVAPDSEHVEVFLLSADATYPKPTLYEPGDRLTSALLPGLEISVADLLAQ
jgi:Uma2 family endonuclease